MRLYNDLVGKRQLSHRREHDANQITDPVVQPHKDGQRVSSALYKCDIDTKRELITGQGLIRLIRVINKSAVLVFNFRTSFTLEK